MAGCLIGGATAGLRALGAARASWRVMLIASALFVVGGVAGAYLDGAAGTVDGAAASTVVGALVWWWQLRLAIRESPILSGRATATGSLPLAATVAATPSRPAAAGTQAPAAAGTPAPDATGQPLPTGRHRRPASAHHQA